MSYQPSSDVLADFVIDEVPVDVRASMNEEQIKAVRSAAKKRHAIDLRFVVPLLFTQVYFVVLVGKDSRMHALDSQRERRGRAGFQLSSLAIAVISAIAVVAGAVLLYVMKSNAGIDLFPRHAGDVIGR